MLGREHRRGAGAGRRSLVAGRAGSWRGGAGRGGTSLAGTGRQRWRGASLACQCCLAGTFAPPLSPGGGTDRCVVGGASHSLDLHGGALMLYYQDSFGYSSRITPSPQWWVHVMDGPASCFLPDQLPSCHICPTFEALGKSQVRMRRLKTIAKIVIKHGQTHTIAATGAAQGNTLWKHGFKGAKALPL